MPSSTLSTCAAILLLAPLTLAVRITRPTHFQHIRPSTESATSTTHLLKRLTGDAKTGVALGVVCGVFAIVSVIVAYTGIMYNRRKKAKAKQRQLEMENGIALENNGSFGEGRGAELPPDYQQAVNQAVAGTTKGIDLSKIRPSRTG